jgi:hypothetical protein
MFAAVATHQNDVAAQNEWGYKIGHYNYSASAKWTLTSNGCCKTFKEILTIPRKANDIFKIDRHVDSDGGTSEEEAHAGASFYCLSFPTELVINPLFLRPRQTMRQYDVNWELVDISKTTLGKDKRKLNTRSVKLTDHRSNIYRICLEKNRDNIHGIFL